MISLNTTPRYYLLPHPLTSALSLLLGGWSAPHPMTLWHLVVLLWFCSIQQRTLAAWYVERTYSDPSCGSLDNMHMYEVGRCIYDGNGGYMVYLHSMDSVIMNACFDSNCSMSLSISLLHYYRFCITLSSHYIYIQLYPHQHITTRSTHAARAARSTQHTQDTQHIQSIHHIIHYTCLISSKHPEMPQHFIK